MAIFGSKQILGKTYPCMGCGQTIKLQRKDDDSGWNKYNLDGSPHIHEQQKRKAKSSAIQEQEQSQQPSPPPPQQEQASPSLGESSENQKEEQQEHTIASLVEEIREMKNQIASLTKSIDRLVSLRQTR
jgi:hypothetical protein